MNKARDARIAEAFEAKPESVASIVGALLHRVAITGEHSGTWGNNKEVEKATRAILDLHNKLLGCVTIEHASNLLATERDWWHRRLHRATGIPCDGTMEECKRAAYPKP